jgi:hypothetical protein
VGRDRKGGSVFVLIDSLFSDILEMRCLAAQCCWLDMVCDVAKVIS